jgi:hypothetical protein
MTLAFSDDSHSDDHSDTGHGRVDATAGRVRHSDSSAQAPSSVRMDAYSQVGAAREGNCRSGTRHDTVRFPSACLPSGHRHVCVMRVNATINI